MTPEQQLVQQITQLLSASQLENNAQLRDLASQFAEVTQETMRRLARCADYLNHGMRSEAVGEARNTPPLLEVCEILDFPEARKWRNLCESARLPVPAELNAGQIAQLKEAVSNEQNLEPLLKQYRRAVYQQDHAECIRLLRSLREQDGGNPNWGENLRPLEQAALPEVVARAEQALANNDLQALRSLYDQDLAHPQRIVPPPPEILAKIRVKLMEETTAKLKSQAEKLVEELSAAVQSEDSSAVTRLLEQASQLIQEEAFLAQPNGWEKTLDAARTFLQEQQENLALQEAKRHELDHLNELLSGNPTAMELQQEWSKLVANGAEVTEQLQQQVESRLDELVKRGETRRTFLILGSAIALVAIVVALSLAFAMYQRGQRRMATTVRLQELLKHEQYQELQMSLDALASSDPELANSPAINAVRNDLNAVLASQKQLLTDFGSQMERLELLRASQYQGRTDEEIKTMVQEATALARQLDKSSSTRLNTWISGWESWKQERINRANTELHMVTAAIESALAAIENTPFDDTQQEKAKLQELRAQVSRVAPYTRTASESERDSLQAAVERLDAWERSRKEQIQKQTATRKELARLKRSLSASQIAPDDWRKMLNEYLKIAPQDDPFADGYQRILKHLTIYSGAAALANLKEGQLNSEPRLQELANGPARGTIWEADLRTQLDSLTADTAIRGQLNALLTQQPELLTIYCIKYRPVNGGAWRRLYLPEPLKHRNEKDADGTPFTIYWGKVYHTSDEDGTPVPMHTQAAFPERFDSHNYQIDMARNIEDNRCEYAKFLFKLVADGASAKSMPDFLLDALQHLFTKNTMEPVLRTLLIKRLLNILQENCPLLRPELQELSTAFAAINTEVPWMNENHLGVQKAEEELKHAIATSPVPSTLKARLEAARNLLHYLLTSQVRQVGFYELDKDGSPHLNLSSSPTEIWAVFPESGNGSSFRVLCGQDRQIPVQLRTQCFPGMPLYAPAANRNATGALDKLAIPEATRRRLARPHAWPENAWN